MFQKHNVARARLPLVGALAVAVIVASVISNRVAGAAPPKRPSGKPKPRQKLPNLKSPEDKRRFLEMIRAGFPSLRAGRRTRFEPEDLDENLERHVARGTRTPFANVVDDETFIRRVSIDVTGKFPTPDQIRRFVTDTNPPKRALLIDELLATDDFARKWARYWRSVIFYESNANKNTVNPQALEDWLFQQFQQNTPWDQVVAEFVSASPKRNAKVKPQENGWNQDYGPNNFVLACERKPEIVASQTARLFMGISIGCAECHDHPFDNWSREQFHGMAAFFGSSVSGCGYLGFSCFGSGG